MSLVVRINGDTTGFNNAMKEVKRGLNKSDLMAVGQAFESIGQTLTKAVTLPLLALGAASVKVGMDFESSMNTIAARTGMAEDSVVKLGDSFREMALACDLSSFSAREVADAFAGVAIRGQTAEDATSLMSASMILATGTSNDLAKTAYFLGNYLEKVGKDASYAGDYIDVFALILSSTTISLADLQKYIFNMTPAFNAFGTSVETNTGLIEGMYRVGVRGATLYSGFGTILNDFGIQGDMTTGMLERFNVAMYDANGQATSNKDRMFDLAKAMAEYEDQTYVAGLITETFNQQQAMAWSEFMRNADAIRNDIIPAYYAAGEAYHGLGIAAGMAMKEQEGLAATGQRLRAVFEEIKLTIAEYLLPVVLRIAEAFKEWLNRFNELSPETQALIVKIGLIAAAVGPLLIIIGKAIKAFATIKAVLGKFSILKTVAKMFVGLGKAIKLLLAPKAAVVIAIGFLVKALIDAWRNCEVFREKVTNAFNKVKEVALIVFEAVGTFVKGIIQGIREFWDEHGEAFMEAATNAFNMIKEIAIIAFEAIRDIVEAVWPVIQTIIENAWEAIKAVISAGVEIIKGIIQVFIGIFTADWEMFWNGIKRIGTAIWSAITSIFEAKQNIMKSVATAIWNAIKAMIEGIWNGIKSAASAIWNAIQSALSSLWSGIKNKATERFTAIMNSISNAWSSVQSITSNIWGSISSFLSGSMTSIQTAISNGLNAIRNGFTNVWNSILSFLRGISLFDIGQNIIQGLVNGLSAMAGRVKDTVRSLVNLIPEGLRNMLGINSPATVLIELGEFTGQGFVVGLQNCFGALRRTVDEMARMAMPEVPKLISRQRGGEPGGSSNPEFTPTINVTGHENMGVYLNGKLVGGLIANEVQAAQNRNGHRVLVGVRA